MDPRLAHPCETTHKRSKHPQSKSAHTQGKRGKDPNPIGSQAPRPQHSEAAVRCTKSAVRVLQRRSAQSLQAFTGTESANRSDQPQPQQYRCAHTHYQPHAEAIAPNLDARTCRSITDTEHKQAWQTYRPIAFDHHNSTSMNGRASKRTSIQSRWLIGCECACVHHSKPNYPKTKRESHIPPSACRM